jgi:uncharacterized protein
MRYLNEISAFIAGIIVAAALFHAPTDLSTPFQGTRSASTNIAAVSNTGEGSLGAVNVKVSPVDGSVLLNADPFIETDTQVSAKTAKQVAEIYTNDSLVNKDITYSFRINGEYVGGPSAGAAMTFATIAATENRTVPEDIAVTGTVMRDGTIGKVGGVLEKAEAAGENDLETFYVPDGQAKVTYYVRTTERDVLYPGLYTTDVEYVPRTFSINNYTRRKFNMSTREVSTIDELYTDVFE